MSDLGLATKEKRDLDLAAKVSRLSDDAWIGSLEMAAITGFSLNTIRQRKIPLPPTDPRFTSMRWRLGDVREWMRGGRCQVTAGGEGRRKGGRPRKGPGTTAIQAPEGV